MEGYLIAIGAFSAIILVASIVMIMVVIVIATIIHDQRREKREAFQYLVERFRRHVFMTSKYPPRR